MQQASASVVTDFLILLEYQAFSEPKYAHRKKIVNRKLFLYNYFALVKWALELLRMEIWIGGKNVFFFEKVFLGDHVIDQ